MEARVSKQQRNTASFLGCQESVEWNGILEWNSGMT